MSRTLSDIFYKIVIGLIIVAIVIGVRDAIITDQALSAWFGQLLGELPFANAVAEPVMKALGFRTSVPFVTVLLGRKVMTNLDSIFKSRDITLPTKVHVVKAMVFPVVMHGCESWTVKKAEHRRIDAFELWCWRRLLRVPWTARRSN